MIIVILYVLFFIEKYKLLEEKFNKLKEVYTKLREEHIKLLRQVTIFYFNWYLFFNIVMLVWCDK